MFQDVVRSCGVSLFLEPRKVPGTVKRNLLQPLTSHGSWNLARFQEPLNVTPNPLQRQKGFTLLELMIAVMLLSMITVVIAAALNTALDSWMFSKDELALQKVMLESLNGIIYGDPEHLGVKDSLEIVTANPERIDFIPPWTDDTHSVAEAGFVYHLNRAMRPGSAPPIAQVRLAGAEYWKIVPVKILEEEHEGRNKVQLKMNLAQGSELRFILHPDGVRHSEVIKKIYWDEESQQIYMEDGDEVRSVSQNLFGVKITNFRIRYFTIGNKLVSDHPGEKIESQKLFKITGVEVRVTAELNKVKRSLYQFIHLRNAPLRTGYIPLEKDLRITIPDSKHIHSLMIQNFSGISENDQFVIDLIPKEGKDMRVRFEFDKVGRAPARVRTYTVESPIQTAVFADNPGNDVSAGVNFLTLGGSGLFDYDFDQDISEDQITLTGPVELVVSEMDMEGAGLFLRP